MRLYGPDGKLALKLLDQSRLLLDLDLSIVKRLLQLGSAAFARNHSPRCRTGQMAKAAE